MQNNQDCEMNNKIILFTVSLLIIYSNAFAFSGKGNGTKNSPYLVSNADELFEIRGDLKAYYKLIQDIDVSEWITDNNPQQGWMSIGSVNEPFTGTIDGGGFSVVNLMCNRPSTDYVGFIGYLKGTLTNISFVNPQIVGQQYVGIVGYLYADNMIENVVVAGGQISGVSNVGGIVGATFYYFSYGDHYGTVLNSYCSADVTASEDNVGGICGYLDKYGRIQHCAYNGKLSGNDYVGGIVGRICEINYCMYNVASGTIHGKKSHVGGIEGYWEGKTYIGVFSGLFLFIAMLSVITTMTRVVKNQRTQIGTLKALGYKDKQILTHYIGYGFYISLLASILGLIAGYFIIGKTFISLEMAFFEIPNGKPAIGINSFIVAAFVVLIVSLITLFTCRNILKENPAETLRNKAPNTKKKNIKIKFKKLSFSSVWNIRDIFRNKLRTFMGIAGVVGSCTLIVAAFGMLDSMNYFVDLQFEKLYNFDYKLTLKEDISEEELNNLKIKYGKNTSKTYGIEIKEKGKRQSNNIFVTDANEYVRFVDNKGKYTKISSDKGVYITYKLSETKGYKLGDTITWHIYGDSKYYKSKIVGFNKDPQNQNLTMTKKYLESLNIKYKPDALYTNKKINKKQNIKGVEVIQDIEALKDGMTNMLSMMKTMLVLIISIAIILGAIIIYNLGILSYTEKELEFATLKVLGFKDKQIKNVFIKQNNWIALVSIIIGLPSGFYLTDWLFKTAIEEHYDFGASITVQTYIISAIGTFVVSYIVSKFLSRKIEKIDMVTSLKGNE